MLPDNVPLCVRLTSAAGDKHITRRLSDLSFRNLAVGGMASAELIFAQPLDVNDPVVSMYGKVIITDGRHGGTVWEGRQEDPGRNASSGGQILTLQAFGPAVHADDDRVTACYVDNGIEAFQQTNTATIKGAQVGTTDDNPPLLQIALPNGLVVGTSGSAVALCRLLDDCGQNVGRYSVSWDSGVTDANFTILARYRATIGGAATNIGSATLNTGGGTITGRVTADIPTGSRMVDVAVHPSAAGTIADDNHWITARIVLQGTRYSAAGAELTAAASYTSNTVTSDQVVADLLGRTLTQYDGALASIAAGAFPIDRLVYPDPTPPAQIFDDLMALDPAYFWTTGASTVNGKYSFAWQTWPTVVRYELSITDDFDSPGAVGDVYNRCLVRYRDRNGRTRSVLRSMAQAELDAAGLIRTYDIDLGDEIGSAANAAQAGDNWLADHNSAPNAGTLTVNKPILDLIAGRMVAPWEIQPGNLIRVRKVLPRVDALNASARDAVTVFRLFSMEYQASSAAATLGLDSYSRTLANQIMQAHRRIDRLRKR